MKICYFGMYDPLYSRNRVMIRGLKENGVTVLECQSRAKGLSKYFELYQKHQEIKGKYNFMIVGFPGQTIVPFAKLLTNKKIIFDAFSSHYEGYVVDRGYHHKFSLAAIYYWFIDWLSFILADEVLFDTQAHIDYVSSTFHLKPSRFKRVFVGSDDNVFYPRLVSQKEKFVVYFHGTYIPLQGIEHIVRAAKILENQPDIEFRLLGKGQTFSQTKKLAEELNAGNVKFLEPVVYEQLPEYLAQADIVLGIFGQTEKAARVIPNKVFEALAMQKAVITEDSPAIRELLTDGQNVLLCQAGDAQDLANKILELKDNQALRQKIAENGYQLFKAKLTPKILVKDLL